MKKLEDKIFEIIEQLREEIRINDQRIKQLSGESTGSFDLTGLMLKSIYDTDNNSVVDNAEKVSGSYFRIAEVNGDLWLSANAYYDGTNWNRIDTSKYALAIQIQGYNNIPGESIPGVNIWRAVPGSNPIGDFMTYGGWEAVFIGTAYASGVLGGTCLEVDGNGVTNGYARINALNNGTWITLNAYWDGSDWQPDDYTKKAMALHLSKDMYASVYYWVPGEPPINWTASEYCKARAYKYTNQSVSADTDTRVQFDNADPSFGWDTSINYRWTCPNGAGGKYRISAIIKFDGVSSNNRIKLRLLKNGTEVCQSITHQIGENGEVSAQISDTIEFSDGDYLELWCRTVQATTIIAGSNNSFLVMEKLF